VKIHTSWKAEKPLNMRHIYKQAAAAQSMRLLAGQLPSAGEYCATVNPAMPCYAAADLQEDDKINLAPYL